jgi:SpoU rRNA methylase family enzyme
MRMRAIFKIEKFNVTSYIRQHKTEFVSSQCYSQREPEVKLKKIIRSQKNTCLLTVDNPSKHTFLQLHDLLQFTTLLKRYCSKHKSLQPYAIALIASNSDPFLLQNKMQKTTLFLTLAILALGNAFTIQSAVPQTSTATTTALHMAKKLTKEEDLEKTISLIMNHVDGQDKADKKGKKKKAPKETVENVASESESESTDEEEPPITGKKRYAVKRAIGKMMKK